MKVYVVTSGEYSDFDLRGVFSSSKNAEQYRKNCEASSECQYSFNDIIEWELDHELKETEYIEHYAAIMIDTGEECERRLPNISRRWGIPESSHWVDSTACAGRGIAYAESHKSIKHAVKLAIEARQEWLRSAHEHGK
jgi:hypothetical protein